FIVFVVTFFFFFQAEDGIRDWSVTGVQTCALPISRVSSFWVSRSLPAASLPFWPAPSTPGRRRPRRSCRSRPPKFSLPRTISARSEERRVGKEGRTRWGTEH